jgi:predicted metalloprotease with PDZ domain
MEIRLSPEAAAAARRAAGDAMTVEEFLARFPEVPRDLKDEPVLAQYVAAFGLLLREARKPTPCMGADGGDAQHHFYTALVNDLAIYGIGLARRERTLARLGARLEDYRKRPATYACTLVPPRAPGAPRKGCA